MSDLKIKEYTCNTTVQACPMTRGEYNQYRGWKIPADENQDDEGFLCWREDESETWVPKDIFLSTHWEAAAEAVKNIGPDSNAKTSGSALANVSIAEPKSKGTAG